MKIEKIELLGFKSFAEKTVLQLHPGITCIVGPNGCGKSNIIDAFRWVLGEQSAKTLRGNKMQEIIFNGSETKEPCARAEVTLYLKIANQEDNGDSAQKTITITRRLFRSGESEYMINRKICRLKDIKEIFLNTGLDVKRYSILQQGDIGEIINVKPQDRRFLIEEIAGVVKYKIKKQEAEAKLQTVKLNLQRVQDILSEVKRQRDILYKQAKKAKKYNELNKELKKLELKILKKEFLKISNSIKELTEQLNILKVKESEIKHILKEKEAFLQKRTKLLSKKDSELYEFISNHEKIEKNINKKEKILAVTCEEIKHLSENIHSLQHTIEINKKLISEKELRIKELITVEKEQIQEIEKLKKELSLYNQKIHFLQEEIYQLEDKLSLKRKEIFDLTDKISNLKNIIQKIEMNIESTNKRISSTMNEIEKSKNKLILIQDNINNKKIEIENIKIDLEKMKKKQQILNNELVEKNNLLNNYLQNKIATVEKIASIKSRISSLQEMISIKFDENIFRSKGINFIASISDVIKVEKNVEKAIEAAFAEKIQGLFVSSENELKKAVEIVKKENIQKVTFLLPIKEILKKDKKFNTFLSLDSFVKTDEGYENIIKKLLEDFIIVKDISEGIEITKSLKGIKAVTLHGEVIECGGIVTCGKLSGVLQISREIRNLSNKVQQIQVKLKHIEGYEKMLKERINEIKDILKKLSINIVSQEQRLSLAIAEKKRHEEETKKYKKKIEFFNIEIEQLKKQLQNSEKILEKEINKLKQLSSEKKSFNDKFIMLQDELNEKRAETYKIGDYITEIKVKLKGFSEQLKAVIKEKQNIITEINYRHKKLSQTEKNLKEKKEILQKKKQLLQETHNQLIKFTEEINKLKKIIDNKKKAFNLLKVSVETEEKEREKIIKDIEIIRQKVYHKEVLKVEFLTKLSNIIENAKEKYGIDIKNINNIKTDDISEEESTLKIKHLKEIIKSMGNVNIAALEQYKEIEERFQFFNTQYIDIVKSINEISETIEKIDKTTKKRLKEAFYALNQKFSEVFKMLFGGGFAELRLTENDILNAGIEIIVQPPGKRLRNINLLSGGEKALTAIALMFGSFLLKPTPICILDEVDAPLDEVNTEKFKQLLQRLKEKIQFVIITHNRITMESAEHIYGITMQEVGVSKVLSLQLSE